jgi:WD40 repeat protein
VALSSDGRAAVSGSDDRTVRVWDLYQGRCTAVLEGHTGGVRGVALSADGRAAVSGSADQTVRVWDLAGGRCTAVLEGHTGPVFDVALSSDGRTAVSGSSDQTVRVWDLAQGRCTATHPADSEGARKAWTLTHPGPLVPDVGLHGFTLRATDSGEALGHFPGSFITGACSADGRHVVAGDARGGVYLLRLRTRRG